MKFYIMLFAVSICLSTPLRSLAQIRHVRGIKSIDASYLLTRYGSGGSLGFVKYQSNKLYFKGTGFYEKGKDAGILYQSIGIDVSIARTLLRQGHINYVNALGGVTASIDRVLDGAEQYDIGSEFKGGAFAGLEDELFITDKIVLLLAYNQRFLLNSTFGNYRWHATVGIRFNL